MLDGIKWNLTNAGPTPLDWFKHPLLEWYATETKQGIKHTSEYKALNLTISPCNAIYLKGSLHQSWNVLNEGVKHNANDFSFQNSVSMINHLEDTFEVMSSKSIPCTHETGLNFNPGTDVRTLLNHHVIGMMMYGKDGVQPNVEDYGEFGKLLMFRTSANSKTLYKLYNKGQQYTKWSGGKNTLRWEKKRMRADLLKPFGISTVEDLKDREKIAHLVDDLISDFRNLMIVDHTEPLNTSNPKLYSQYLQPKWWAKESSRTTRKRRRDKYQRFIIENDLNTLHEDLTNRLIQKANTLLHRNASHGYSKKSLGLTDHKKIKSQTGTLRTVDINANRSTPCV